MSNQIKGDIEKISPFFLHMSEKSSTFAAAKVLTNGK